MNIVKGHGHIIRCMQYMLLNYLLRARLSITVPLSSICNTFPRANIYHCRKETKNYRRL